MHDGSPGLLIRKPGRELQLAPRHRIRGEDNVKIAALTLCTASRAHERRDGGQMKPANLRKVDGDGRAESVGGFMELHP